MTDFKIDPEFRDLLRPLTVDEFTTLSADCVENGIRDPLIVWDGILVDGHNRFQIATLHGLKFSTIEMHFKNRDYALYFMVQNQIARRNLNAIDRLELTDKIKPAIVRIAQSNWGGYRHGSQVDGSVNMTPSFKSDVPQQRSAKSLKHDLNAPNQPENAWGEYTVEGNLDENIGDAGLTNTLARIAAVSNGSDRAEVLEIKEVEPTTKRVQVRKEVEKLANVGGGTVSAYERIKKVNPDAIIQIRLGLSTIDGEYQKILRAEKAEKEKALKATLAASVKDYDLGISIEDGLYSSSGMKSRVVVNYYDSSLASIARTILNNSEHYIVLARLGEITKVPEIVAQSMQYRGATVLKTSDKGIYLAMAFGDSLTMPAFVEGSFVDALANLLGQLIGKTQVAINPYPTDGLIAQAFKKAELFAYVFSADSNVTTAVRADFAQE